MGDDDDGEDAAKMEYQKSKVVSVESPPVKVTKTLFPKKRFCDVCQIV